MDPDEETEPEEDLFIRSKDTVNIIGFDIQKVQFTGYHYTPDSDMFKLIFVCFDKSHLQYAVELYYARTGW